MPVFSTFRDLERRVTERFGRVFGRAPEAPEGLAGCADLPPNKSLPTRSPHHFPRSRISRTENATPHTRCTVKLAVNSAQFCGKGLPSTQ